MATIPALDLGTKLPDLTTVSLHELGTLRTPALDEAIGRVIEKLKDADSVQEERR